MAKSKRKKKAPKVRVQIPMNMTSRSWDRREKRLKTRATRFRKELAEEGPE